MPLPGVPLEKLGFLTIGLFDGDDPGPGIESTLQVIELGERLAFLTVEHMDGLRVDRVALRVSAAASEDRA